ncbi:hypothetical protein G6045_27335 [Streptomyces sp. YC504]|uniref:Uncharacterized protein n=1 Tax=Streptomyces mesophilus TaxID=1775132 RepID=A0A6G4XP31_9ACTN|nr:hypothetical protein [Streptomyces mesophilus]NGO79339.1 hypothetical protein [Streptomyces mesophilus]
MDAGSGDTGDGAVDAVGTGAPDPLSVAAGSATFTSPPDAEEACTEPEEAEPEVAEPEVAEPTPEPEPAPDPKP